MPACSFSGCKSRKRDPTNVHLSFHRFPREIGLKRIWLQACKQSDDFPTETARVCSRHFDDTDFERDLKAELLNLKVRSLLKPTAVPRERRKKVTSCARVCSEHFHDSCKVVTLKQQLMGWGPSRTTRDLAEDAVPSEKLPSEFGKKHRITASGKNVAIRPKRSGENSLHVGMLLAGNVKLQDRGFVTLKGMKQTVLYFASMPYCSAVGCKNSSDKKRKAGVTFHKLPKDPEQREKWIKAINRDNWDPTAHATICSEHFPEADMDRTSLSCVRLREGVVPSLFSGVVWKDNVLEKKKAKTVETEKLSFEELIRRRGKFKKELTEAIGELVQTRKEMKRLCQVKRRIKKKAASIEKLLSSKPTTEIRQPREELEMELADAYRRLIRTEEEIVTLNESRDAINTRKNDLMCKLKYLPVPLKFKLDSIMPPQGEEPAASGSSKRPVSILGDKEGRPMKKLKISESEGSVPEDCLQDPLEMIEIDEPTIKQEIFETEEFCEIKSEGILPNEGLDQEKVHFEEVYCTPSGTLKEEHQDDVGTTSGHNAIEIDTLVPEFMHTEIKVEPLEAEEEEDDEEEEITRDISSLLWRCPLVSCPEMFSGELEMYQHLNLNHVVKGASTMHNSSLSQLKGNQELMWEVLLKLAETLKRLEKKMDKILSILEAQSDEPRKASENPCLELKFLAQLPVKVEEVDTFEAKLKDPAVKQRLTKYLSAVGGKDVRAAAANLMRRMFRDEIGEKYSLTGKTRKNGPGKKPFIHTQSFHLVYGLALSSKSKKVSGPRSAGNVSTSNTKQLSNMTSVTPPSTSPSVATSGSSGLLFFTTASSPHVPVTSVATTSQPVPSSSSGPVTVTTTFSYSSLTTSSAPLVTTVSSSSLPSVSSATLIHPATSSAPVASSSADSTPCLPVSSPVLVLTKTNHTQPSSVSTPINLHSSISHSPNPFPATTASQGINKIIVAPISDQNCSSSVSKKFLLLTPQQQQQNLGTNAQSNLGNTYPVQSLQLFERSEPTTEDLPPCAKDHSEMFSISLARFPENVRVPIKKKMLNVVDCIRQKNISPEKLFIAYYDNSSDSRTM